MNRKRGSKIAADALADGRAIEDTGDAAAERENGRESLVPHDVDGDSVPVWAQRLPHDLVTAIRSTLPVELPGDRYPVRALTGLWLAGLTPHTARSYGHALRSWLHHCLDAGLDPLAARRPDVDDWVATRLAGLSPSTVRARLAALTGWYGYLIDADIDVTDPAAHARRPAGGTATPTSWCTLDQLRAILDTATARADTATPGSRGHEIALRTAAILRLLIVTGLRSGPVLAARYRDLTHNADGPVLRHHRKGHSGLTDASLSPDLTRAMAAYLHARRERLRWTGHQVDPDAPLFASVPQRHAHGAPVEHPLDTGNLTKALRSVATEAGLQHAARLTPHSLRHSHGTALLADPQRRHTIRDIQDHLGHASVTTTQLYTHPDTADSPVHTMEGLLGKRRVQPASADD